jgi:tRNA nucleotidyltransferase/poly(A) polymerase
VTPDPGARGLHEAALASLLARPGVARVFEALDGRGEEVRIVGGAVRNALIGEGVHEIDFCTTAAPEETSARARAAGLKAVPTGVEHGTVTVVAEGEPYEVTTLREDVETDGRHARVRFGRSFEADALRRDFTINALMLTRSGEVVDHAGGLADLAARRVRFIGDPATRIREDYLRILRFFRFHASYAAGPLDGPGFRAAVEGRDGLAILSRERVRAELLKLLAARRAPEVVEAVQGAGLLARLTGGVGDVGRLRRAAAGSPEPVRRLAALACLHEGDAPRLRDTLRLSNAEHARLLVYARVAARLRSAPGPLDGAAIRRLAAEHGVEALGDAAAALTGEPRPLLSGEARAALDRFVSGEEPAPVLPVRGADLVARGVPPGPGLGEVLARVREAWLAQGCPEGEGVGAGLLDEALGRERRTGDR